MPATALWIGLPRPEMPGEAAGRAAWFMFLGLTPAASICRTVVAGNTLDTPRLRRCAFAGAVVRLGAVRMAATRRRSRYLGGPGIDWTSGDGTATAPQSRRRLCRVLQREAAASGDSPGWPAGRRWMARATLRAHTGQTLCIPIAQGLPHTQTCAACVLFFSKRQRG